MIQIILEKIKKLQNMGAIHITVGTFATKFVAFFGSIVVVRILDKNEYGLMSYVENIYSYVFIFAGLGLSYAVLRYLVLENLKSSKKSFFNYILKRSILYNLMLLSFLLIIGFTLKLPKNYEEARMLIPIVALLLPFQDLLNVLLYTIRAFFKNKLYACLAFFSSFSLILGRVMGAYLFRVKGTLWSRVIINAVFCIVIFIYVSRVIFGKTDNIELTQKKKREVDKYALQYMITNGFWAIFMLNDTFFISHLLNDPVVLADYKVASVIPGNISIFATAIGIFVGPYFTKNEKNREWIKRNYKKVFGISALIVGIISLIVCVFSRQLILLIYGERYLTVCTQMNLLTLAAFINSGLRYTTANLLSAMGEVKYNMAISGTGIVLQALWDFIMMPRIGVIAAAIGNCIIFGMMALVLIVIFYKKYY